MTLLTKGMGAIRKAVKKGTKSVKQGFVNPKTNKPLYVAAGTVWAFTHARHGGFKSKKKKKDKDKK